MSTMTLPMFGERLKEPTYQVWVSVHSPTNILRLKDEIYWQGEYLLVAIYKLWVAKSSGHFCVTLEWRD